MSFLFIFKKDIEIYMEKYTQKIEQIEKSYLRGYLNIFTASHHLSGFQKIDITAVNFTKKVQSDLKTVLLTSRAVKKEDCFNEGQ